MKTMTSRNHEFGARLESVPNSHQRSERKPAGHTDVNTQDLAELWTGFCSDLVVWRISDVCRIRTVWFLFDSCS